MALPDYETIMLPLLRHCDDGQEHRFHDLVAAMAAHFKVTEEEQKELLPSGRYPVFRSRVSWAKTYLVKAGLLASPRREWFRITGRGRQALQECQGTLNTRWLMRFEEFRAFQGRGASNGTAPATAPSSGDPAAESPAPDDPPQLALERAYARHRDQLLGEVLEMVRKCSDAFFEELVLDVILAMGYGGSRQDAGKRLGKTGDHGVDGVVNEDRLGLDVIYLQAKRWIDRLVGEKEIRDFIGALDTRKARKGVFITTSDFTRPAVEAAERTSFKIILLNGLQLASLMIEYNVGVSVADTFHLKRLDTDYFVEER